MGDDRHLAKRHASTMALIVIDMINIWTMPGGAQLRRAAWELIPPLSRLIRRARQRDAPVIYANDNFGQWRSNLPALIEQSRNSHGESVAIIDAIGPHANDYVVLKPEHSAFYATPLEPLLEALRADRLVLTGVSADQCVLATAGDALLRNFEVTIPRDTMASPTQARQRAVVRHFQEVMNLRTPLARSIRWNARGNK